MVEVIALDGDDTLWHSEGGFAEAGERLAALLEPWAPPQTVDERLYRTESANLPSFGYGVKAFTLSMVETAVEVSGGQVPAATIAEIVALGRALLHAPVELLDGVEEALETLAGDFRLVLLTKGDLVHQERKIADSGLAEHFDRVEIVSEKDTATYARLIASEAVAAPRFLMAGNSLRSDVLPPLDLGARAAHIPYAVTWVHEQACPEEAVRRGAVVLGSLAELPPLATRLAAAPTSAA